MVKVRNLSNGIPVVIENMDYLRTVSFGVWVRVGSAFENVENNGMSHFLEHMFFKGTNKRSAKNLADDMAVIGGNLNAATTKEYTSFYVTTLDEHINAAIDIVSDMLISSRFDEDDFEREKSVILEEIMMYDDSPEDVVHERLQQTVWKNHPLGFLISGEADVVKGFTRDSLVDFYKTHYVADNMIISVAGKINEEKLMESLERGFGKVNGGSNRFFLTTPEYNKSMYVEEKDIEQVHMNLAFPGTTVNSDKKYAFAVANSILGGSDNSRLFQHIREEMGMTYSIYSYDSPYLRSGLSHIDVVLNPSNLEAVFDGILSVIREYRCDGMSDEELSMTKTQIKSELLIANESSRTHMESNGKSMMYRGEPLDLREVIDKISAVSREDVTRSIQEFFNLGQMSASLVGNVNVSGKKYIESFI
jgi:predicted Zn-dependent peptidase